MDQQHGRLVRCVVVIIGIALLVGCGDDGSTSATTSTTREPTTTSAARVLPENVEVLVRMHDLDRQRNDCEPVGPTQHVDEGSVVTLRDEEGTVLATEPLRRPEPRESGASSLGPCVLVATFANLDERTAYTAEVEGESSTADLDDIEAELYRIFIDIGPDQ